MILRNFLAWIGALISPVKTAPKSQPYQVFINERIVLKEDDVIIGHKLINCYVEFPSGYVSLHGCSLEGTSFNIPIKTALSKMYGCEVRLVGDERWYWPSHDSPFANIVIGTEMPDAYFKHRM